MARSEFNDNLVKEILKRASHFMKKEERFSYLSALGKVAGSIEYTNGRMNFVFSVPTVEIAMNIIDILKVDYQTVFELLMPKTKNNKGSGGKHYAVSVPAIITLDVMRDLGLIKMKDDKVIAFVSTMPELVYKNQKNAEAYFDGLFVACGSVFVPSLSEEDKKDGYHFEFAQPSEDLSESIVQLLNIHGIHPKTSERNQNILVYLKDKDEILGMLSILGAVESAAELKNIINERMTSNIINRSAICEAHNLDKTFVAASKHLLAIGTIEETVGLETLPKDLYDTAQARMDMPQASLNELSEVLGVSKSCLNHRLRKIVEIAAQYTDK